MGKVVGDGASAFVQAFRETPKMKDVTWMHWSFHIHLIFKKKLINYITYIMFHVRPDSSTKQQHDVKKGELGFIHSLLKPRLA